MSDLKNLIVVVNRTSRGGHKTLASMKNFPRSNFLLALAELPLCRNQWMKSSMAGNPTHCWFRSLSQTKDSWNQQWEISAAAQKSFIAICWHPYQQKSAGSRTSIQAMVVPLHFSPSLVYSKGTLPRMGHPGPGRLFSGRQSWKCSNSGTKSTLLDKFIQVLTFQQVTIQFSIESDS